MQYTTLKSATAASSRNGTRIYLILLCHFMTQNQMLRCSPETFRLSSLTNSSFSSFSFKNQQMAYLIIAPPWTQCGPI